MGEFKTLKGTLIIKGIKREELCDVLGIGMTAFNHKINGQNQWTYSELQKLRKYLELADDEFINIFFNQEVPKLEQ